MSEFPSFDDRYIPPGTFLEKERELREAVIDANREIKHPTITEEEFQEIKGKLEQLPDEEEFLIGRMYNMPRTDVEFILYYTNRERPRDVERGLATETSIKERLDHLISLGLVTQEPETLYAIVREHVGMGHRTYNAELKTEDLGELAGELYRLEYKLRSTIARIREEQGKPVQPY